MNLKEIKELIEVLKDSDVTEIELEKAGTRIKIKKGATGRERVPVPRAGEAPAGEPPAQIAPPPAEPSGDEQKNLFVVNSPIVGTFYRAPTPDAAVYVEVGDVVKKGQILCIIEAMKLMNEIEAEVSGKIVAALVDNAQPVEYGEPLFHIEPV
ncbi:MAG: acetyl-CoA carboxylase biotin carboxyl carrier protein [Nitrospirota bacterium]